MSDATIRRRDFIAGATAVTGLAVGSDGFAGISSSLHQLSVAEFEKLIGEPFHVAGTDERENPVRGTLVLSEVITAAHPSDAERPLNVRRSGFALRFSGPANLNLAPGMHSVTNATRPKASVFLRELVHERSPRQRQFEAVFN